MQCRWESRLGEDTPYPEMGGKDSPGKRGGEEKEEESPDILLQTPASQALNKRHSDSELRDATITL